ncbi:hypothetical protein DFH06DRAFT_1168595 [Mycena polygramma]|nr:hypothetical protein DFH06DRAFT_1168595 [Mycena polygramma]
MVYTGDDVKAHLKAYAKAYAMGALGFVLYLLTPFLIETYYPQAAPIATALVWIADTAERGLCAVYFIMAVRMLLSFGHDACKILVRMCSRRAMATGPVSLEDGTADAERSPPAPTLAAALCKLLSCLFLTYLFACLAMLSVSFQRPMADNVRAVALYLLSGLEVLLVLCPGLLVVVWVKRKLSVPVGEVWAPVVDEGGRDDEKLFVDNVEAEA